MSVKFSAPDLLLYNIWTTSQFKVQDNIKWNTDLQTGRFTFNNMFNVTTHCWKKNKFIYFVITNRIKFNLHEPATASSVGVSCDSNTKHSGSITRVAGSSLCRLDDSTEICVRYLQLRILHLFNLFQRTYFIII